MGLQKADIGNEGREKERTFCGIKMGKNRDINWNRGRTEKQGLD